MVSKTITKKTGKEKEDKTEVEKERVRRRLQAKIEGQAAEEEARMREDAEKRDGIRRQQMKDAGGTEGAAREAAIKGRGKAVKTAASNPQTGGQEGHN